MTRMLGSDALLRAWEDPHDVADIARPFRSGQLWTAARITGGVASSLGSYQRPVRYEADDILAAGGPGVGELEATYSDAGYGHILDGDTLFLWRMDEAPNSYRSTIINYGTLGSSLNAVAATVAKAADVTREGPLVSGAKTYARKFRGGDQTSHQAAHNATLLAATKNPGTYEFMVKIPDWGPAASFTSHTLFTFGTTGGNTTARVDLRVGGNAPELVGTISFVYFVTSVQQTYSQTSGTKRAVPGKWAYFAIVLHAATIDIYCDGVLVTSQALGAKTNMSNAAVTLGSNLNTNLWSGSYMKGLKLTATEKTAAQISTEWEYVQAHGEMSTTGTELVWWKMDETGDLIVDDGPYETHLAPATPALVSPAAPLIRGDGYSKLLNLDYLPAIFTHSKSPGDRGYALERLRQCLIAETGWTLECWYLLSAPLDDDRGLFCYGDTGNAAARNNFLTIDIMSNRTLRFWSEYGTDSDSIATSTALMPLGKHHLAIRRNANPGGGNHTVDLFVDGVLVETLLNVHPYENGDGDDQPLVIGYGAEEQGTLWYGQIDDMRFSKIPRTDDEIAISYWRGVGTVVAVEVVSPQIGSQLDPLDPVTFDVTSDAGLSLANVLATLYYGDGSSVVVWNGSAFAAGFEASSTTPITGGYRFELIADWAQTIARIDVSATDPIGESAAVSIGSWIVGGGTPQLTVLTTFSADFRTGRLQSWQGSLTDWPSGSEMAILVHYVERNEMYVARDAEGNWRWPFDLEPDNAVDLNADPVTVQLTPRGGWPPCDVEIQIAAAVMAEEV